MNYRTKLVLISFVSILLILLAFLLLDPAQDGQTNVLSILAPDIPSIRLESNNVDDLIITPVEVNRLTGAQTLRSKFDASSEGVDAGDPNALFNRYQIVSQCSFIGELNSRDEFESALANLERDSLPAETISAMRSRYEPILEDCIYINSQRGEGQWDQAMWAEYLLDKAALTGSRLAQIELLIVDGPKSSQFSELAALLEQAVRSADYRAYYQVARFYANFFEEDAVSINATESIRWQYFGCYEDPECDAKELELSMQKELAPWEVQEILNAPAELQDKIAKGEPFGFKDGWMPISSE